MAEELVKAAAEGGREAYVQLYSAVYEKWYRTALCCLCDRGAAAEATAENAVDCYKNVILAKKDKNFPIWSMKRLIEKIERRYREGVEQNNEDYEGIEIIADFANLPFEDRLICALSTECELTEREIDRLLGLHGCGERLRQAKIRLRDSILSAAEG